MTSQSQQRILFVFTSASENEQTKDKTGWYLPEAAHPYYVLKDHFGIDFAAPEGPNPPLDPSSENQYKDDEECQRFLEDKKAQSLLKHAMRLDSDKLQSDSYIADNYIAIYYLGGRGPLNDLPECKPNTELANKFYRSGKLVSAVCHGPAGLVSASRVDGANIFKDIEATAFSDAEELEIGDMDNVPFSIEERIKFLGGKYVKAENLWDPKVVRSGNLITGQNPASARPLAEKMKEVLLQKNKA